MLHQCKYTRERSQDERETPPVRKKLGAPQAKQEDGPACPASEKPVFAHGAGI
jgi:hypothetical protein